MAGTITHQWTGTVLTITSDSGTSSSDLKGAKGDDGARGAQGAPGSSVAEDSQKLGGVAAAQYALKNNVPAHNLLDNSDFRNPVNQRGATSWTAHGVYCIDRWKTESANNAANISYTAGSGITLTPSSTNYAGIIQQFENYSSMTGKVYTIAICVNNVWYSGTFTMGATPSGGVVLSNGIRIYSASGYNVLIRNPAGQSAITIQRAALYEGSYDASTLPAYQPKGYAAELAECQRYYYQTWTGSIGANGIITRQAMALSRLASVELPCTMRTTPTITLYTSNGQAGAVKGWLDSVVVSGMTVVYANSKSFIPAHEGSGLTIGNWYGFHYTASADL